MRRGQLSPRRRGERFAAAPRPGDMTWIPRASVATCVMLLSAGCSGDDGAAPPPPAPASASPTPSAAAGGFAPGPRVTCPGPGRVVYTDTERGPDEPIANTPKIALKRFVAHARTSTGNPRYDLRYFSPIELPAHYDEKERSEAARFAGYRANDSIFVILSLQRYNAQSGWVQSTIESCTQQGRLP